MPHKIAVGSIHRCANDVHINEQVIVLSASLSETLLVVAESVGKMDRKWLSKSSNSGERYLGI